MEVFVPYPPEVLDALAKTWPGMLGCCHGAAMDLSRCTCWEPVFDLDQAPPDPGAVGTIAADMCHDCAYRAGSPERADEHGAEHLVTIVGTGEPFYCHQGMRRAVGYRHPAMLGGRLTLPAGPGDYQPPRGHDRTGYPVAYRADGTVADLCHGWSARRLHLISRPVTE